MAESAQVAGDENNRVARRVRGGQRHGGCRDRPVDPFGDPHVELRAKHNRMVRCYVPGCPADPECTTSVFVVHD